MKPGLGELSNAVVVPHIASASKVTLNVAKSFFSTIFLLRLSATEGKKLIAKPVENHQVY